MLLLAAAALLRCGEEAPRIPKSPPPQTPELLHQKGPDDSEERTNLLNFAHGAVAVSRTGEISLQNSALCAIDGDPATPWLSPPDEEQQSLLFALPANTRVTSVGINIGSDKRVHPKSVDFDASPDGKTFRRIASFEMPATGRKTVDVAPVEANFIRYNTRGRNGQYVRTLSVVARGELLEPAGRGSLDGCWSLNGVDARFRQRGASVTGTIAGDRAVALDGGSDGRFFRLLWIRGPEYGVAAISVTADGRHLSGMFWHEEAYLPFLSETWFGEKRPCGQTSRDDTDVLAASMQRNGRYVLYGLQFDAEGQLAGPASEPALQRLAAFLGTGPRVQIVAHELGQTDGKRNQAISQAKLDSLRAALRGKGVDTDRVPFLAVGSDKPHRPAYTDATRSIYGTVELIRR